MYPNLYYFFKEVFNWDLPYLKFVNSFGFFVAISFILAAVFLTKEIKRKEAQGLLGYEEKNITVGAGPDWIGVLLNSLFGFIMGFKFIGLFVNKDTALADPQSYMLSSQGSVWAGIALAGALGFLKWREGSNEKLAKPETRTIRVWVHDKVGDMTMLAFLFGFLGAKLFDNLENWDEFIKHPIQSLTSFSGLTFYGGLICAALAIIWYAKSHKINLWHLADSMAPALMIAYAVGRIGCQVAGDGDWGILNTAYVSDGNAKIIAADSVAVNNAIVNNIDFYKGAFKGVKEIVHPQDVPHASVKAPAFLPNWMVAYNYPHNVNDEGKRFQISGEKYSHYLPVPVFPTPFYETIVCFSLFLFLWSIRKKIQIAGLMSGIYLMLNGAERFLVEKIRVNTEYHFGFINPTQAELISGALFIAGLCIYLYKKKQPKIAER